MSQKETNFLNSTERIESSDIIIAGVPFDGTSSFRPGSRFAPDVIRSYSVLFETYSPYQRRDVDNIRIYDIGNIDLLFGNTEKNMKIIEEQYDILNKNKKPIISLGGEHLISFPIVKSLSKNYDDLHILHFDAHADLRTDYLGEKYSHASVIRLISDITTPQNIYQFGIRSGTEEEFEFAGNHTNFYPFSFPDLKPILNKLENKPVYITIDLDILDPSYFPGTGTPEPGGVSFNDLLFKLIKLKELNIVGADIVELSPDYDKSGISAAAACKVLRELILIIKGDS